MAFLVRKIARGKWPNEAEYPNACIEKLPAKTITVDLQSRDDCLSTWKIDNLDKLEDAILILATAADRLGTIYVAIIDWNDLEEKGLEAIQTEGNTEIEHLKETHYDIINLNYKSLGKFADLIIDALKNDMGKRYTDGMLKKLIKKAIEEKCIDTKILSDGLKKDLKIS